MTGRNRITRLVILCASIAAGGSCTYPYHKLKELSTADKYIRVDIKLNVDNRVVTLTDYNSCVMRAVGFSGQSLSHTVWRKKNFYAHQVYKDGSALVSYFPDCDEELPLEYHPWIVQVDNIEKFKCYDYYHTGKDDSKKKVKFVSATASNITKEEFQKASRDKDSRIQKLYDVMFSHGSYLKYDFRSINAIVYTKSQYKFDSIHESKLAKIKKPSYISRDYEKFWIRLTFAKHFGLIPNGDIWEIDWNKDGFERWCDLNDHPYLRTGKIYPEEVKLPAKVRIGNKIFNAKEKNWIYIPDKKYFVYLKIGRGYQRVNVRNSDKTGSIDYGDASNM